MNWLTIKTVLLRYKFYVVGGLLILLLMGILREWVSTRGGFPPAPVVTAPPAVDLQGDRGFILCVYAQKDCVYANIDLGAAVVMEKCGSVDKCDSL